MQTLKECVSCHIYWAHLRPPRLWQPLAQYLLRSPGTSAARELWRGRSEKTLTFGRQNGKAFDVLPWQMQHDTTRWHQICPYPYTCTALMRANGLLHWRRQSQCQQSPLGARNCSLRACTRPERVHCARMPCTFLHLPCPYMRASSVDARLPYFLCLHKFESLDDCVWSALWVCTGASNRATTIGRGLPPIIMVARWRHLQLARGRARSWLGAHRYLLHAPPRPHTYPSSHTTLIPAPTLHHTLTPSTLHVSELDKIVFPKYSSQSILAQLTLSSWYWEWIPNLGALTIIASVPLTPIPCLFACFYESVLCVYVFFSTCVSAWVANCVVCVKFCNHNHHFVFCLIFLRIQ